MKTKKQKTESSEKLTEEEIQNKIRERAYFRWLTTADGQIVDENKAIQFWLEAESEIRSKNS